MDTSALGIPGLQDILLDVGEACVKCNVDFFIAGSIAKNVSFVEGQIGASLTKDVDFVVHVPQEAQYYQIKEYLVHELGYSQNPGNEFRVERPDGNQIDLLPFGSLEIDGGVERKMVGLIEATPNGLEEVFAKGLKSIKLGGHFYQICTLPAIVILKLIAYDDRPLKREKDIQDINGILEHYEIIEDDLIWSKYDHLYDTIDSSKMPPFVLGQEMKIILEQNDDLTSRVIRIIQGAIEGSSAISELMIKNPQHETIEGKKALLKGMLKGISTRKDPKN